MTIDLSMLYLPSLRLRPNKASLQMTMQSSTPYCLCGVHLSPATRRTNQTQSRHCNERGPQTRRSGVKRRGGGGVGANPRLATLSESYWRDTWRRPSSAPFPGCCCCAGVSCWNSDKACVLLPGEIRKKRENAVLMAMNFVLNQFKILFMFKFIMLRLCLTS